MVVLDINTKKVIYQSAEFPEHVFWSTEEYWVEYQAACREAEKREMKLWYDR